MSIAKIIKNNSISTALLSMAVVAASGMFFLLPSAAHAQISEPQQLISQLLERVAELQSALQQQTFGSGETRAVLYEEDNESHELEDLWERNLSIGTKGDDVRRLQVFLNEDPDTQISISGAGARGKETNYFGPATARALKKFQEKYKAEILSPNGLHRGSGFLGKKTRAKMHALKQHRKSEHRKQEEKEREVKDDTSKMKKAEMQFRRSEHSKSKAEHLKREQKERAEQEKTVRRMEEKVRSMKKRIESVEKERNARMDKYRERRKRVARNCTNDSTSYKEGDSLTTLKTEDGGYKNVSDGSYVCRSGEWKIEGSYPDNHRGRFMLGVKRPSKVRGASISSVEVELSRALDTLKTVLQEYQAK